MQHHHNDDDDRDQHLFGQCRIERTERFIDQSRPIVERHDRDLRDRAIGQRLVGQSRRDLLDTRFNVLDGVQGIVAIPNHHHPANGLGPALIQGATTLCRPLRDLGDILDIDRDIVIDLDDGLLDIDEVLDETQTTNDVFDLVDLDRPRADVDIRGLHRLDDLFQGHAIGPHRVGVHVDLVLAHEAADRSHFADPLGSEQGIANVPVLDTAQLVQVPATSGVSFRIAPLQRVPKHLSQSRRVKSQGRLNPLRQGSGRQAVELLQHPAARPVELHTLLEDYINAREAEERIAAHRLDAGKPQQ